MATTLVRTLTLIVTLGLAGVGVAQAQECRGTITAEEAMKAETARYAAQTTNDFAAMEKLFGNDLTYNHSSSATDDKAKYIDAMRSGRTKYRKMTPNGDVKTRTYGCIAIITRTAVYEVTAGGQNRTVPLRFTAIWAQRARDPSSCPGSRPASRTSSRSGHQRVKCAAMQSQRPPRRAQMSV